MSTFTLDIDQTLCDWIGDTIDTAIPIQYRIDKVNKLYDDGHTIQIFTARGMCRLEGNFHRIYDEMYSLTKDQLAKWGVQYHLLALGKLPNDFFIDDKNLTLQEFDSKFYPKTGFIAGAFDIIHPGYIEAFEFCKTQCEYLIVGLHTYPAHKDLKPVFSVSERVKTLKSIKYIDEVVVYFDENDLIEQLGKLKSKHPLLMRFLGDDYKNKIYTGNNLDIPLVYVPRTTGWNTTLAKKRICNQVVHAKEMYEIAGIWAKGLSETVDNDIVQRFILGKLKYDEKNKRIL